MAAVGKEGRGDGGLFDPILALRVNRCEIPIKGRSGGWQPGGESLVQPDPCTCGVSHIPTQCRSLEEDDGEGCTTVQESPGIEALCSRSDGERLARGEADVFCNSLQRVFLKCYCSLGLPPQKKKKKRRGKKAMRKSNLSVRDESGLS